MAIVYFNCDSGANIKSCRTEEIDTVADLCLEEGEWESLSDDDKHEHVSQWANERLEIYWTTEKPSYR